MDRSGESMNPKDKHADWLLKPTANELADIQAFKTEELTIWERNTTATMLRQQQDEIEDLKNAKRFIQNFAEEQHQRAVALEMRELTDEEIIEIGLLTTDPKFSHIESPLLLDFARAILRKAQEK